MLIRKDTNAHEPNMTKYRCDRCDKEIGCNERAGIFVQTNKNPKKKWDLCMKCYRALVRGIENKK